MAAIGDVLAGQIGRRLGVLTSFANIALGRGSEVITKDWLLQVALEGRIFHAQQGNAATLVDFVETAYDEDQPQFALTVPEGLVVIPLHLENTFQDQVGTDNQVIWSRTNNDIGLGTSTALAITNMRTDAPRNSGCKANSLYTANAVAATGLIEFKRFLDPFAVVSTGPRAKYAWDIKKESDIPIIVGPGTLQNHIFATTDGPEGFGEYVWVELETSEIKAA